MNGVINDWALDMIGGIFVIATASSRDGATPSRDGATPQQGPRHSQQQGRRYSPVHVTRESGLWFSYAVMLLTDSMILTAFNF